MALRVLKPNYLTKTTKFNIIPALHVPYVNHHVRQFSGGPPGLSFMSFGIGIFYGAGVSGGVGTSLGIGMHNDDYKLIDTNVGCGMFMGFGYFIGPHVFLGYGTSM
jgi:hypothetical protein